MFYQLIAWLLLAQGFVVVCSLRGRLLRIAFIFDFFRLSSILQCAHHFLRAKAALELMVFKDVGTAC
jgi:hypothetical protein